MLSRGLRLICLVFLLPLFSVHASDAAADETEARLLYQRANDFVSHIGEDGFSYAYIQFHWKRAQSNLDRIARVYPHTPTGKALLAGQLPIGPFEPTYFRDRVLPRIELKKLAAYDAVNCAIFLHNLEPQRRDEVRVATMMQIIEVLCRQQRWNEARAFPVFDQDRLRKFATIAQIAARYDQGKVLDNLLKTATAEEKALVPALRAEGLVLLGKPRDELFALVAANPDTQIREAALRAAVDREIRILRGNAAVKDISKGIPTVHYSVLNPTLRDDVPALAARLFPSLTDVAQTELARFAAARGQVPSNDAPASVRASYLDFLAAAERFDDLQRAARLPEDRLVAIELLATAGRTEEAERAREALIAADPARHDDAWSSFFTGQMNAAHPVLTAHATTFSALPLQDSCRLAQLICAWSLTPNRSLRGASPWDPVVQKWLPGFTNLPLPDSKEVQNAAASLRPY